MTTFDDLRRKYGQKAEEEQRRRQQEEERRREEEQRRRQQEEERRWEEEQRRRVSQTPNNESSFGTSPHPYSRDKSRFEGIGFFTSIRLGLSDFSSRLPELWGIDLALILAAAAIIVWIVWNWDAILMTIAYWIYSLIHFALGISMFLILGALLLIIFTRRR